MTHSIKTNNLMILGFTLG